MVDKQILFFAVAVVSALVLVAGIGAYGYQKSQEIAEIPCLSCMALNQAAKGIEGYRFGGVLEREHPPEVTEALKDTVLFLHFRTRDCEGCDIIEPVILDIEEEYVTVLFAHVHLYYEGSSGDIIFNKNNEREVYNTYDTTLESEGHQGGTPMMTIITLNENEDGIVEPYYLTEYNADLDHAYFREMLDAAFDLHDEFAEEYEP